MTIEQRGRDGGRRERARGHAEPPVWAGGAASAGAARRTASRTPPTRGPERWEHDIRVTAASAATWRDARAAYDAASPPRARVFTRGTPLALTAQSRPERHERFA